MPAIYFQEIQRSKDNRWVWIGLIAFSLLVTLPLISGLYWQLIKGEPWGDKPMSDDGLIIFCATVFTSWGLAAFIMLSISLEVRVDVQGFHYKYVPLKRKWRTITKIEIADYKLENKFNIFQSGGLGYHRSVFRNTRSFKVYGCKHIALTLRSGEKYFFGTQDLTGMEYAMQKLMETKVVY